MSYAIFSNSNSDILNISSIGYSADKKITRYGPSVRDQYIIHYVISGKGYFNNNSVNAGQGFLITPGMFEEYHSDHDEPWEFLWFISNDEKMKQLFTIFGANEKTNIFDYSYIDAVKKLKSHLILNKNKICNSYEMLELFLSVFKNHTENNFNKNQKSNANIYLDAAINYIHTNYSNSITVNELTSLLGISQPYLYKIFMENLKKSPKQYIQDLKLTHAENLLKNTDMSITQIALSVGFQDVLTFSKFFALKSGLSPSAYKNICLNNKP